MFVFFLLYFSPYRDYQGHTAGGVAKSVFSLNDKYVLSIGKDDRLLLQWKVSVCLSVCLSISLSVCLSLSDCLSVCPSLSSILCLFLYLSIPLAGCLSLLSPYMFSFIMSYTSAFFILRTWYPFHLEYSDLLLIFPYSLVM